VNSEELERARDRIYEEAAQRQLRHAQERAWSQGWIAGNDDAYRDRAVQPTITVNPYSAPREEEGPLASEELTSPSEAPGGG
jgi:hypothetical protein